MSVQERRRPKRLRRLVGAFFANKWLFWGFVALGALAGQSVSWLQKPTYEGKLELGVAAGGEPTRALLPDTVRLHQLIYSPMNLRALLDQASAETPEAEITSLARTIQVSPVPTGDATVRLLTVEIEAANSESAREKLRRYADLINQDFRDQVVLARNKSLKPGPVEHEAAELPGQTETPTIVPTSYLDEEAGDDQAGDRQQRIEDVARELGVSVEELPAVVEELRQSVTRRSSQISEALRESESILALVNKLETQSASVPLPSEARRRFPEVDELEKQREAVLAETAQMSAYLKPAHPDFKAMSRRLAEIEQRLAQARAQVAEFHRQEIQRREADIAAQRDTLAQDRRRLAQLETLVRGLKVDRAPSTPTPPLLPAPSAELVPSRVLSSAAASVPVEMQPSRVVLRLSVEDSPIRPRATRNVTLGAMLAAVLASIVLYVRSGADQRILGVDDLESLDLGVTVFGSIPRMRVRPVHFSRGRTQ